MTLDVSVPSGILETTSCHSGSLDGCFARFVHRGERGDAEAVRRLVDRREAREVAHADDADAEALVAFHLLAEREGIIPALEPAHALARALELDAELILVGLSGRGDKDLATVLSR